MSLEKLNEVATAVASIREALDSGRIAETKEREALAAKQKELEERLAKAEDSMRRSSISLPGSEELAKNGKFSIGRAIRAMHTGNWDKAPVERDVHIQCAKLMREDAARMLTPEQRATLTTVPSAAGYLIPEELSSVVIERPHAMAVTKQLGLTVVRPNGWPFKVNKRTTGLTAYMVGENVASTASDVAVGQVSLSPRKCVARTFVTAEQLAYGNPQTDSIIGEELNLAIELKKDDMVLNGSGASGEPIGVFNTTGINTTAGIVSGRFKFHDISVAMQKIEADNVMLVNPGCVFHSDLKWELAQDIVAQFSGQVAATDAAYVAQFPFLSPERFRQITGCNMGVSNQVATTKSIMGEWKYGWLAEFGGMVLGRSDVATDGTNNAFTQEGVHIKLTTWFDFAVVLAEAFAATTSV